MIRFGTTLFEEPGCNHLEAVLEALAAAGIRARTGPWTWDQAGPAGAGGLPDWLRMDADAALDRLAQGIETVRKFNHPRILDAVTIEGVGTCSDPLNRGAADLAREYDSLFVCTSPPARPRSSLSSGCSASARSRTCTASARCPTGSCSTT